MTDLPPSINCYSEAEQAHMKQFRALRARLLKPILPLFSRLNISASHISSLGLVFGLASALALYFNNPWCLALLALHILCDGLDGPVAEFQHRQGTAGSFWDSFCDMATVTAVTAAAVPALGLNSTLAILYVFTYTLIMVYAFVVNALQISFRWLVRPRFAVYAALAVQLLIGWPVLMPMLGLSTLLLIGLTAWGTHKIYYTLRQR